MSIYDPPARCAECRKPHDLYEIDCCGRRVHIHHDGCNSTCLGDERDKTLHIAAVARARIQGACDLLMALDMATGHADNFEDVVAEEKDRVENVWRKSAADALRDVASVLSAMTKSQAAQHYEDYEAN